MGDLIVRRHDDKNFTLEYYCESPHILNIDVTENYHKVIDDMDLAGRLYQQMKKDYPGMNVAAMPKFSRLSPDIGWYVLVFNEYDTYRINHMNSSFAKFGYDDFLAFAVANFLIANSVKSAVSHYPLAKFALNYLDRHDNIAMTDTLDMTEVSAVDGYLSFRNVLAKKVPSLNYSETKRLLNSARRQIMLEPNFGFKGAGMSYGQFLERDRILRMDAEREEMLRKLRAANRWK